MPRFNRRFEVKRETRDGGTIRPDNTKNNSQRQIDPDLLEELGKVGFDDDIDIELDDLDNEDREEGTIEEKKVGIEALTNEETSKLLAGYRNTSVQGELAVSSFLGSQAKKLGVDKEELKSYLRQQEKSRINSPEKVLHYHRTSLESAKKILESGHLLNRANIQLNGGDISHLSGSSSANVQFTVDRYDENGQLLTSGYNPELESGIGAASTDIVFVMSPELLEEESYDCSYQYPIVEKANIQKCCATILAKNPEVLEKLQSILAENGIQLPTMLQEEFDRESILESLTNDKEDAIEFEDESVTPKITHSDVEQELSEYYTDDITMPEIEAYLSEKISQIYGDRLGNAGIFNVKKFLDGKLNDFQRIESYNAIIEDLEATLEAAESVRNQEPIEIMQDDTIIGEPIKEDEEISMDGIVGRTINQQDDLTPNIEQENGIRIGEEYGKSVIQQNKTSPFEQALTSGGFKSSCIEGLKSTIKSVNPRTLVTMDNRLSRTQEQTLSRGGLEADGNEQNYR